VNESLNRKIRLRLPKVDEIITLNCREGESLLEALLRNKLPYRADCGGRGTCGKCRVKLLEGKLKITAWDKALFGEEELKEGYRLSCKAYPEEDCLIELLSAYDGQGYEIVTDMAGMAHREESLSSQAKEQPVKVKELQAHVNEQLTQAKNQQAYAEEQQTQAKEQNIKIKELRKHAISIAIDLGTTTLVFALVDHGGRVIRTYSSLNPQRAYGADVISRIKASTEGRKEILRDLIRAELEQGIKEVIRIEGIRKEEIRQIMLAGNTSMIHLLMGYDCSTLGVYPFNPVNLDRIETEAKDLLSEAYEMPFIILPGISAFVGGDILAGLLACGFDRSEELCLFVDLGTNGEMALGNHNRILVSSTAAGPAFEGGNLSCGVGSIPGAISHVAIKEGVCSYETIGGKTPVGICGTGVIELVSELLRNGFMDESGLLADPYFEEGFEIAGMRFLQKDIRELQMAKAAVRTGIEILIRKYGVSCGDIHKVYLAGGFGYKLNVAKAVHIGLFPPELKDRIEAVGNSCLAGIIRCLTKEADLGDMEKVRSVSQELHLSNEPDFYESYIGAMSF
jgi:uncharacterized 2Fe-2S/4Fe-4S cluster protein (DUF4445 family)